MKKTNLCVKVLKPIHVNIFDVLEFHRGQRQELRRFDTVKQLAKYSKKNNKIFPKRMAKRGALKFLLRKLFSC